MAKPLINITQRQAILFAIFLLLYEFLTYIANDMIMPGMILVVETFHASESAIANSLMAYLLGGASLQLILGPLSDRFGRRPVMLWGAVLFFICTIAIACSHSLEQFMVGRFFQGMGLCFIGVVGYTTIQEIFAEMDAVRFMSVMASVSLVAPLIGPLLGAIFIHFFLWRWIFVVIGFFALIALWGLCKFMPETVGSVSQYGEKTNHMVLLPQVIAKNYLALLHNDVFIKGSLAQGLQILPCIVWIALAPIILVKEAKLSYIEYGLWQLPIFGACILGTMSLRMMTYRRTLKELVRIGAWIVNIGLWGMFIMPLLFGNHYKWLIPGIFVYFFGMGFGGSPLNRLVLFSTSVMKGTASALISILVTLIQVVGLLGANVLYTSHNNLFLSCYCLIIGVLCVVLVMKLDVKGV